MIPSGLQCPMTVHPREAGPVVPVDAALNEPPMEMKWLRGKPVPKPIPGNPSN